MQVKQYFSFTICPLIITSRVRGGGRYVELPVLSEGRKRERSGVPKADQDHDLVRKKLLLPDWDRSFRETGSQ